MAHGGNGQEEIGIKVGNKVVNFKGNFIASFVLLAFLLASWGFFLHDTTKRHDNGIKEAHAQQAQEMLQFQRNFERLLTAIEGLARHRATP